MNRANTLPSPKQIALVQDSMKLIEPIAEQAAELFYQRLFQIAPELRPMFATDIKPQEEKLIKTLQMAVTSLTNLELLVPKLEQLARQHKNYGVKKSHFDPVNQALLYTLEQGLGANFSNELRHAWQKVMALIQSSMEPFLGEK